jgi:hypothetical protein
MSTLIEEAIVWLFGCHHHNLSWVFTIQGRTYQVCCDCGAEFEYSWQRMHRSRSCTVLQIYARISMGGTYLGTGDFIGPLQEAAA